MRKRSIVAVAVAALAVTSGTLVYAAPAEDEHPADTTPEVRAGSVTLPTGDRVSLRSGGAPRLAPGDGREDVQFFTPKAMDGSNDLIMIPTDRMNEIASGADDARRYNVSELLRAGQTDAAKASAPDLSDKSYGRYVPVRKPSDTKAGEQKLTVKLTNHSGGAPQEGAVFYSGIDNEQSGEIKIGADGTGSASLPAGRYDVTTGSFEFTQGSTPGEYVGGVLQVTVKDKPVTATADGKKAEQLSSKVDRPAEQVYQEIRNGASSPNSGAEIGTRLPDGEKAYLIPTKQITDHEVYLAYRDQLESPATATDEYGYNLMFHKDEGIPSDLEFEAPDSALAKITTAFDGFGGTEPAGSCLYGGFETVQLTFNCEEIESKWGTSRVDYVTADKDVSWYRGTCVGELDSDCFDISDWDLKAYEPGQEVKASAGHAPVAFNPYSSSTVTRAKDTMNVNLNLFDNVAGNEEAISWNYQGLAVIKRDGKELGRTTLQYDEEPGDEIKLPKGDKGRYVLDVTAESNTEMIPLGTKTAALWEFESKPTTTDELMPLSAVHFQPEGVSGGFAEVGKDQKFELTYAPLIEAADTKAEKLGFEVSYDDGKTWTQVDIERDGDKATGSLKHPADAKFVSVRFSATDDKGTKVTHSTLRSYGLK